MRKHLFQTIPAALILSLAILSGCSASESAAANTSAAQNDNLIQERHVMRATITEIVNSTMTVTPVEGSDELKSSDRFTEPSPGKPTPSGVG